MNDHIYFDTSALAKWYINEPGSGEVETYIIEHGPVAISSLTSLEIRSLLARRRRNNDFPAETEMQIFSTFNDDIREGHLFEYPLDDEIYIIAIHLVSVLPQISVRSLDALHLAACKKHSIQTIATADQVIAEAGEILDFRIIKF
jgi:predicted nucleic acid-binding protein